LFKGFGRPPTAALVLMPVLLVACLVLGWMAANRPSSPVFTGSASSPDTPTAAPVMAVLGDSWGQGAGADAAGGGFAWKVAAAHGWTMVDLSQGGTGFISTGPEDMPDLSAFPDRVADVVAADPDVVIVAGGNNDSNRNYTDDQVRDGVSRTLQPLIDQLPDATILVIGPFVPNGFPNESQQMVNTVVGEEATALGLPYISPQDLEWITGSRSSTENSGNQADYIGPDGAHPNQAGHDYLATLINAWLATIPDLPAPVAAPSSTPSS
jgi:lysophospholipase L1-like esterase